MNQIWSILFKNIHRGWLSAFLSGSGSQTRKKNREKKKTISTNTTNNHQRRKKTKVEDMRAFLYLRGGMVGRSSLSLSPPVLSLPSPFLSPLLPVPFFSLALLFSPLLPTNPSFPPLPPPLQQSFPFLSFLFFSLSR